MVFISWANGKDRKIKSGKVGFLRNLKLKYQNSLILYKEGREGWPNLMVLINHKTKNKKKIVSSIK